MEKTSVAVIGYGYWGPNLVRNFSWNNNFTVSYVCDLSQDRLSKVKQQFPNVKKTTSDFQEIFNDSTVDAVAIATPVSTHYKLAKAALEAGKHLLLEKPMVEKSSEADELIEIAKAKGLVILVDHTFVYTGAVRKIKELVASKSMGDILYFDSVRVNLGLFQSDINVVWDLAPHDLSIMKYVLDKKPLSVSTVGVAHFGQELENIAYMTILLEDDTLAHFHFNWLSPIKMRKSLIGGSEKMIVYDDMENVEKIKVFDKGITLNQHNKEDIYKTLIQYRTGDMLAPKIDNTEALQLECDHFHQCIKEGKKPITDGEFGRDIVKILEASQLSIKENGKSITLK